jgi:hypothetical protein
MNEGMAFLVAVGVGGLCYFTCSMFRHGSCNMGKLFTLLVVVVGFVTGILIFVHVFVLLRGSNAHTEDTVWSAVAGIVLCFSSTQEIILMFRELFSKRVQPTLVEQRTENHEGESQEVRQP